MFTIYSTEDVMSEVSYEKRRQFNEANGKVIVQLVDQMRALLDVRVEDYDPSIECPVRDPNDRHVHAAAVACGAGILLTHDSGFTDLPPEVQDELPYEVHHADDFFCLVDDSSTASAMRATAGQLRYWLERNDSPKLAERLRAAGCPRFAERVEGHLKQLSGIPRSRAVASSGMHRS